jgi:hypothetical protein
VLADDTGTRAIMTAHWLVQMGWDVCVLDRALEAELAEPATATPPTVPAIAPDEAARWIAEGAAAVSLDPSAAYRTSHPHGAVWATRARLDRLPPAVLAAPRILLFAEDETTACLAAIDLAELTTAGVALVRGGSNAWRSSGLPVVASPDQPSDDERIDYLFWNHDRHAGNAAAMRAYLHWETELPGQIAADGFAGFKIAAP